MPGQQGPDGDGACHVLTHPDTQRHALAWVHTHAHICDHAHHVCLCVPTCVHTSALVRVSAQIYACVPTREGHMYHATCGCRSTHVHTCRHMSMCMPTQGPVLPVNTHRHTRACAPARSRTHACAHANMSSCVASGVCVIGTRVHASTFACAHTHPHETREENKTKRDSGTLKIARGFQLSPWSEMKRPPGCRGD